MLGYSQENNDVYIFFEEEEIEGLGRGSIRGTYFNLNDPSLSSLLEVSIDDSIKDMVVSEVDKNEANLVTNFHLKMRLVEYHRFLERRALDIHEGYRHIILRDTINLGFNDKLNYEQLKHWLEK